MGLQQEVKSSSRHRLIIHKREDCAAKRRAKRSTLWKHRSWYASEHMLHILMRLGSIAKSFLASKFEHEAAGIDFRVDLGKWQARLDVKWIKIYAADVCNSSMFVLMLPFSGFIKPFQAKKAEHQHSRAQSLFLFFLPFCASRWTLFFFGALFCRCSALDFLGSLHGTRVSRANKKKRKKKQRSRLASLMHFRCTSRRRRNRNEFSFSLFLSASVDFLPSFFFYAFEWRHSMHFRFSFFFSLSPLIERKKFSLHRFGCPLCILRAQFHAKIKMHQHKSGSQFWSPSAPASKWNWRVEKRPGEDKTDMQWHFTRHMQIWSCEKKGKCRNLHF